MKNDPGLDAEESKDGVSRENEDAQHGKRNHDRAADGETLFSGREVRGKGNEDGDHPEGIHHDENRQEYGYDLTRKGHRPDCSTLPLRGKWGLQIHRR